MPLSNTVLRQYTPPTCTLEVTARTSPLARGGRSRRTAIELLSFVLRFDDPRMPESEPVIVRGNYQQFMDLHVAVNTYVQDLLKTSPENFNTTVYTDASRLAPVSGLQSGEGAIPLESQKVALNELNPPDGKICLEPTDSGLAHKLFFGSLSTKHSATFIQLSVLQLFDLMTALDECAADIMVAAPKAYSQSPRSAPSTWTNIAAVLLLAVGVTTAVAVFLNRTNSSPERQVAQSPIQNNPSPTALVPSPLPTLSATPLPSSLPSPQKLPPLPPLTGTITPNSTKRGQGVNIPQKTTSSPNSLPGIVVPPPAPSILSTPVVPDRSSYGNPPESSLPKVDSTDPQSSKQRHQPPTANSPGPIANLPGTNLPVLTPGNPDLGTNPSPNTPGQRNKKDTPFLPGALTAPEISKGTAFDAIPQVAEARNYFKQRWEPPSGLTQSLQYSLVLDNNGTIQRIIPLGEASRKFVDRSGMPLIGERFVSPISNGHTPTIRVLLNPDGQVQTFLESD